MAEEKENAEPNVIRIKGLSQELIKHHQQRKDRPLCFILGAGASRQSGVPTGAELALRWVKEMEVNHNHEQRPLEEWAQDYFGDIPNFDLKNLGPSYADIYQQRFGKRKNAGHADLEDVLSGRTPSWGYAVLACLIEKTHHQVVITTNFDNLVAEAISLHTETFPITVGHESLAFHIRPIPRRPLVAKVHGDLGFILRNNTGEIASFSDNWEEALKRVFALCTPVVIGYDGNDGTLFDVLKSLEGESKQGIYWCHYDKDLYDKGDCANVPQHICDLVVQMDGYLVGHQGFDELMMVLYEDMRKPLGIPNVLQRAKDLAEQRQLRLEDSLKKVSEESTPTADSPPVAQTVEQDAAYPRLTEMSEAKPEVQSAIQSMLEELSKEERPWWAWYNKAKEEPDIQKRKLIYEAGLEQHPESLDLRNWYAAFLDVHMKDYEAARREYEKCLRQDSSYYYTHLNLAGLLMVHFDEFDLAMEHCRRTLEIKPDYGLAYLTYAQLLAIKGQFAEAESNLLHLWKFMKTKNQLDPVDIAELSLVNWLCLTAQEKDPTTWLRLFKQQLITGFGRHSWSFDRILEQVAEKVDQPTQEKARQLCDAFLDEAKVAGLDEMPGWKELEPLDPAHVDENGQLIAE